MYEKTLYAGWGDVDFNSHMKNTAFLEKSADVWMMFFSLNGFPVSEFSRLSLGPVVVKDEVKYLKEIRLLEETRVTLSLAGLAEDGSRFLMRNEFYRADGKLDRTGDSRSSNSGKNRSYCYGGRTRCGWHAAVQSARRESDRKHNRDTAEIWLAVTEKGLESAVRGHLDQWRHELGTVV